MGFSGQPDWCQWLHWSYWYNSGLDQPQHQAWALIGTFLQEETFLDNKFCSAPASCVHFLTILWVTPLLLTDSRSCHSLPIQAVTQSSPQNLRMVWVPSKGP